VTDAEAEEFLEHLARLHPDSLRSLRAGVGGILSNFDVKRCGRPASARPQKSPQRGGRE
jgi:hypothetical protein